jgi:hypothetical protein
LLPTFALLGGCYWSASTGSIAGSLSTTKANDSRPLRVGLTEQSRAYSVASSESIHDERPCCHRRSAPVEPHRQRGEAAVRQFGFCGLTGGLVSSASLLGSRAHRHSHGVPAKVPRNTLPTLCHWSREGARQSARLMTIL